MRRMAADGQRSPGTVETYERQLRNHVLPALGEIRLAEAATPLIDRVLGAIKAEVSPATARSCRSVVSGIMGLAVRFGAISHNPVREVERISARPAKAPRSLTAVERAQLIRQLATNRSPVEGPARLVAFMLATGCRIGEALAVIWSQVDLERATVESGGPLIRVKGEGLLGSPPRPGRGSASCSCLRWGGLDVAGSVHGGGAARAATFPRWARRLPRPGQRSRDIRDARGADELAWITSHSLRKTTATVRDKAGLHRGSSPTNWVTRGRR